MVKMVKDKRNTFIVIAVTFCMFLLSVVFGGLMYETNDDVEMNMIAAGAYGPASQFLIFSNILLGYFIKLLYMLIPGINCYLWMYLALNLICVVMICLVLTERSDNPLAVFATSLIVNIVLARNVFIEIQFTKNAALYVVCATLLIASALLGQKGKWKLIAATVFMAFGVCSRYESFLSMLPFILVALGYVLVTEGIDKKKLLYLIPPVVVMVMCLSTEVYYRNIAPDWSDYYKSDLILSEKRDFGNYNFSWDEEEYLEAGFTEWDFKLLDAWMYNDPEYFNLEKLRQMQEIGQDHRQDQVKFEPRIFAEAINEVWTCISTSIFSAAVTIISVILLAIYVLRKRWLALAATLITCLGVFGEIYLMVCLRRVEWRAEFVVWGAAFGVLCTTAIAGKRALINERDDKADNKKLVRNIANVMAAIAAIILFIFWQGQSLDYSTNSFKSEEDSSYQKFQAIHNAEGYFILSLDDMYDGLSGARNILDIDRKYADLYSNITPAGGWVVLSPLARYYGNTIGISDAFRELPDRDDMYYIGGGERMGYLLMWLNEKYGPGINVTNVEFDGFTAWKFYRG